VVSRMKRHTRPGLSRILDNVVQLNTTGWTRSKSNEQSVSEKCHPRKKILYQSFDANVNTFFCLRASGVPIMTAYFLSDTSNLHSVYRTLQNQEQNEEQNNNNAADALSVLKKI
jgi:hypothetical protein